MRDKRLRRFLRHGMLPQLAAFEACIRNGSMTRAAEELSLAQPTVSCLVKKLSNSMGGPVTAVRDRRIVATPLGVEILTLCNDIYDALEGFDARLTANAAPQEAGGASPGAMEAAEL
jgi:LysR family transcriptional regulator, low CO2-responsive transcriptional regulator